ncbi:MAG: hypothetical protein V4501_09835 [Pseudomonadota bacterium]
MNIRERSVTVTLPLSEAGKKTILTKLSADGYFSWMLSVLMPFDLLYTYFFRYGRVAYNDMINAPDPAHPITHDNGPMIDCTVMNPDVGAAVTLSFISIAVLSAHWEVERQVKIKNITSAKYVYDQLKTVLAEQKASEEQDAIVNAARMLDEAKQEEKAAPRTPLEERAFELNHTHDINRYIQLSFEADPHLTQNYSGIEFVGDNLKVKLKPGTPPPAHHEHERVINRATAQEEDDEVVQDELTTPPIVPAQPGLLKKITDAVINKFLYPVWQSTVLMSFVFWIEWIGGGILTGDFNPWAVAGLPNAIAYGLPVLAGLLYPAIKIYNYINNYPKENTLEPTADEKEAAEKDMSILLRRALARREFVIEKEALEKKLATYPRLEMHNGNGHANGHAANRGVSKLDEEILKLRGGQWFKPLLMLFSVATGSYVGAQYCTWILSGLANVLLGASVKSAILAVAGWPLIIGPILYGCYKAYDTYLGVVDQHSKIENLPNQDEFTQLEKQLAQHQQKLADLGNPAPLKKTPVNHLEVQYFADVNRRGPSKWTTLNKVGARLFQFINGGCTGIFLARVFFVEGSAISLPFAAAALSYPVTAIILAGIGIGYGLIKTYEYHQAKKDAHAKNLFATRTERLEYLRKEVVLAGLREQVCIAENHARPIDANTVNAIAVRSPSQSRGWGFGLFSDCFGRRDQRVVPIDEQQQPPPPPNQANGHRMNGIRAAS